MKRLIPLALVVIAVAVVYAIENKETAQTAQAGERVVLVELFTSQGCSSCPPADELLRRIAHDPQLRGKVVPLAYHVDYWNRLGWQDPFSSRSWSQRQGEYVRALKLQSAYTPQMVINGSRQLVGSSGGAIYRAIEDESKKKPEGEVSVRIDGNDVVARGRSSRGGVELIVVSFEHGATTQVTRGENSGKTLMNDGIVRKFVRAGTLDGKGVLEERVRLPLGPRMGVAAFLQDSTTKQVLAASSALR